MTKSVTIVANWKMYKTIDEAKSFINEIKPTADSFNGRVLIAVPFTCIKSVAESASGSKVIVGAQNMNDATSGAFTGEVAALMLKDAGAQFVILGHSERRRIFQETDEFINRKVLRALETGLQPILCIGETIEEREAGQVEAILMRQLSEGLKNVPHDAYSQLMIAYEPVWAIGTGVPATPEIAAQVHGLIRSELAKIAGDDHAKKVSLLYGGSANPENAKKFLEATNVDGLLIGNASLKPDSFAKIIELSHNI